MGVQGLWKLLESSGRPVNPETLEGKILAVDISIWLNQAVKGTRDRHGNAIHSAHLLTLFHRLCKLLFFRIRPVFVFDGEAPLLKKQTLVKRRQRKEIAATDSKKTTEKILKTFLKRQAIKTALAGKSNAKFPSLSEIRREEVDDIYVLPSLQEDKKNSSEEEDEKEWEQRMSQKMILQEELCENPHSVDVDSEDFQTLPPDVKHEILTDMKEFTKRRRTLYEIMPEESNDFSQYQLKGLLKKSSLNRHIEKVEKEMNEQHSGQIQSQYENDGGFLKEVESRRVVSEDASHYILIKGIQSKTDTAEGLDTVSAGASSSVSEHSKPVLIKNAVNLKPPTCDLLKTESTSSTSEAPPSPRTVLAIQTAMIGSSSEEEMEDEIKDQFEFNKHRSGPNTNAGNVSPRTLRAIQEALCEEEEDVRQAFIHNSGASREERSSVKDFLVISSNEEEDQVPDGRSGRLLQSLPTGQGKNTTINQENELDQRKLVLEKDQSVPESPCILFVEKTPSSESDKEERGEGTQISDIDVTSVQAESANIYMPQSLGSLTQTLSADLPHSDVAELDPSGNVEYSKGFVREPERSVPTVKFEFTPEIARLHEKGVDQPLQSEESDSDGSFVEVDAEASGECEEEILAAPAVQEDQTASVTTVDMREKSEDVVESWKAENAAEDVALLVQQDGEVRGEEEDVVNEWQDISMEELEVLETNLSVEQNTLQAQKQRQERVAATVTGQMFLECQELLRLFGIPYIQAPMEAEAQCAILDLTDQTSGTITDDSDIWLFGARHVYKNFFSQNKYVEYYQYVDFQNQLGLDRSKLINLAYLLGSDYTEGIPSVGCITAMEILNEFPGRGMEPLLKLMEWWTEAQNYKKTQPNPYDTKVKKKLRQLEIPTGFPNPAVVEAYLHPVVDESTGSFVWGRPDLEEIREFCQSHFGWAKLKTDEALLPVLKQLNAQQTQLRIDSFFRLAQQERHAIKSQRLRRAVTCMRRKEKEEEEREVLEATMAVEEESKRKRGKEPEQGKKREVIGTQRKRKKQLPLPKEQSCGGGGFVGQILLSEVSSGSSAEDPEDEALNRCKRGKTGMAVKIDSTGPQTTAGLKPAQDEAGSSSCSAEEEMPMVTARPVFEGQKAKSKSSRRSRRRR